MGGGWGLEDETLVFVRRAEVSKTRPRPPGQELAQDVC